MKILLYNIRWNIWRRNDDWRDFKSHDTFTYSIVIYNNLCHLGLNVLVVVQCNAYYIQNLNSYDVWNLPSFLNERYHVQPHNAPRNLFATKVFTRIWVTIISYFLNYLCQNCQCSESNYDFTLEGSITPSNRDELTWFLV